jgi:type VI secretion system protein ImpA
VFAEAVKDLTELSDTLRERLAADAPDIAELRSALVQCQQLMQQLIKEKKPADEAAPGVAETADAGDGSAQAKGPVGSRAEAYRQLAQAAAVLRQLEPHSPIPYLVQRAVQLGALSFPEMIRALIREPNVLAELRRELGIPAEETPPAAPSE